MRAMNLTMDGVYVLIALGLLWVLWEAIRHQATQNGPEAPRTDHSRPSSVSLVAAPYDWAQHTDLTPYNWRNEDGHQN